MKTILFLILLMTMSMPAYSSTHNPLMHTISDAKVCMKEGCKKHHHKCMKEGCKKHHHKCMKEGCKKHHHKCMKEGCKKHHHKCMKEKCKKCHHKCIKESCKKCHHKCTKEKCKKCHHKCMKKKCKKILKNDYKNNLNERGVKIKRICSNHCKKCVISDSYRIKYKEKCKITQNFCTKFCIKRLYHN